MMFSAMEQGFKQSRAFKDQIDETREKILRAWQFPFNSNSNSDEELLKDEVSRLQAQVDKLNQRVEQLEKKLSETK